MRCCSRFGWCFVVVFVVVGWLGIVVVVGLVVGGVFSRLGCFGSS